MPLEQEHMALRTTNAAEADYSADSPEYSVISKQGPEPIALPPNTGGDCWLGSCIITTHGHCSHGVEQFAHDRQPWARHDESGRCFPALSVRQDAGAT